MHRADRTLRPISEPFFVPVDRFKTQMSPVVAWRELPLGLRLRFVPKNRTYAWGKITPSTIPLSKRPKFRFIDQIVCGVDPLETDMYKDFCAGLRTRRNIGGKHQRKKSLIRTKEQYLMYFERVKSLVNFVAVHGVLPINEMSPNDPNVASGVEGDIGLAIAGNEIMLFKKGKHRLAAAIALGVEQVPCQCYFVAADALGRLTSRDCSRATAKELRDLACEYLDGLRGQIPPSATAAEPILSRAPGPTG